MSKYCEIKLNDILKSNKSKMTKNKTAVFNTYMSEGRHTKIKLDNLSLLKRKNDNSPETSNDLAECRETRLTKKFKTTKSNPIAQNVDNDSGVLKKTCESQSEIVPKKRKRNEKKVKEIGEQLSRKIFSPGGSCTVPSNKADEKITQRRKRKRKSRDSCWENKLTGAKRVSKRLSNLRMEKQKSLKAVQYLINVPHVSIKSKQPINFSGRGKMKSNKELDGRQLKSRKVRQYINDPEVQINFGKLSYTKRFYPKKSQGRRPPTFTVTMKATGINQQSPKINDRLDEETISDVNSFFTNYLEDIEDNTCVESEDEKDKDEKDVADPDETENKEIDKAKLSSSKSSDQSESVTEESNEEAMTQKNEFESLVSNTVEEECNDVSTIVIIDIESGENVNCGSLEETTRNEQSTEPQSNDAREAVEELKSDFDKVCKSSQEDVARNPSEQEINEENRRSSESNCSNIIENEAEVEPESTSNESKYAVDFSADYSVTDSIKILAD